MVIKTLKPGERNLQILEIALAHTKSVPYRVSLRWLFYRLLQEGYYQKNEYKDKFSPLIAKHRKNFSLGWTPTTLADDTTRIIERVGFFKDSKHLKKSPDVVADMVEITFDPFYEADRYTVIAFEARAMVEQFMYYTEGINLFPFGGDAHIEPKWNMAKHFEEAHKWYGGIPMQMLYFGDLDNKGNKIFEAARKDIQEWCIYPIEFVWCGLTREYVERFNLPENPDADKPGQYQWESLTDPQAKEVIVSALALANASVDTELIKRKIKQGENVTKQYRAKIKKALSR